MSHLKHFLGKVTLRRNGHSTKWTFRRYGIRLYGFRRSVVQPIHGLVAVPLLDYIHYSNRISWYCHSMTFRQVSTPTDESMTTHRQTTGRHDNSATALLHRQPTRRHDHWPTRQVTDNFFKNSSTHIRHSPTETFPEKG